MLEGVNGGLETGVTRVGFIMGKIARTIKRERKEKEEAEDRGIFTVPVSNSPFATIGRNPSSPSLAS